MKKSLLLAALLTAAAATIAQTATDPAPADGQNAAPAGAGKRHHDGHGRSGYGRPDAKKMAERHLANLDTDKDGKVSRQEYLARQSEAFSKTDTNADGFVTAEEMAARYEKHHAEMSSKREARKSARADAAQEAQKPAAAPAPGQAK